MRETENENEIIKEKVNGENVERYGKIGQDSKRSVGQDREGLDSNSRVDRSTSSCNNTLLLSIVVGK